MNISAKFQLHIPYGFWGDDCFIFVRKVSVSVAMTTNRKMEIWKHFLCLVEDYSRNISEKLLSKYLQWDRNICLIPLSHYKSIENICCHSDESTWATAIKKNKMFVEANVMNISTKFQLHPPYGFWGEEFLIFFRKFSVLVAMVINQIQRFGQNSYGW